VIEDLEGATTEPSRRRHVAALSAATAAVALVLFFALVTPKAPVDAPPLAATPAPSPTDARVVIFAADSPEVWFPGRSGDVRLGTPSSDVWTSMVCVSAVEPNPTIHLMVVDRTGQPIAAYTGGTTGRFIALPQAYVGSGWRTVPCPASDLFAPRINRAR
jgi:hypothetical protein